ncbi:Uncharacterised protein [Bordetella pertussis]|nr:Uncharacterised protein [Bordetella pertussis]CFW32497.1 Uncharacterised protein [Bordetella pertussis]
MHCALLDAGTAQLACWSVMCRRCCSPPSPITSMSPITWAWVMGTKRSAPKKLPT